MSLSGIEKALQEGCKLHGFRSGGGLRVIRLEKANKLRGYGEHPNVEGALNHADEDFLAGGRKYGDVYGKSKDHYITGSNSASSELDQWILRGHTIDAYLQGKEIVVELKGTEEVRTPKDLVEKMKKTCENVRWSKNGFTYISTPTSTGYTTEVISAPKGKNTVGSSPWFYEVLKVGKGDKFYTALEEAIKAEEVE
jgi:hypothetical protein